MNLRPSGYELAECRDGLCRSIPLRAADQHFYRGAVMVGRANSPPCRTIPVEDPVEDPSVRRAADSAESPADRHGANPQPPHHLVHGIPPRARGVCAHRCPRGRPHSAGHLSAIESAARTASLASATCDGPDRGRRPGDRTDPPKICASRETGSSFAQAAVM